MLEGSAPTLRREIRRIGAYVLAGDLLLKPVYIPSEDNPGDAPSRGIVRRWRSRRTPALRASQVSAVTRAPVAKRHTKQAAKHKHDRFDLQAYSSELMRRLLHTGSIKSRNQYRRLFRDIDSDISSCSTLDHAASDSEGDAPLRDLS